MKRLVLVLLLTSATARAAELEATPEPRLPLLVSLDAGTVWHLDPSYRLFASDRTDWGGGASARYDVGRLARGTLAIGAGLHGSSTSAQILGGSQEAALSELTPSLSAVLHWRVHRWLEPQVRVAVDGAWTRLSITATDDSGAQLSGRAFSPGASAGAGLVLRTGTLSTALPSFGLAGAFIIEGGFHVGTPLVFSLAPPRPADDKLASDRLPTGSTGVGNLGRSQPYLRLSFALLL